jgi:rhodanese-related sulfurtransferase
MNKVKNNIFYNINLLNEKISHLEKTIQNMDHKFNKMMDIVRSQMIRIKNREEISNDTIFEGLSYNDLSPARAWKYYQNNDIDFIVLDVSRAEFNPEIQLVEMVKVPLEELLENCHEVLNKKTPVLVISEDGCRSTLACELLSNLGYYNLNNVSGGYKYWPEKVDQKNKTITRAS